MVPLGRQLASQFQVWIPDLPGFGLSPRTPRALDVTQLAEALAAWIRRAGLRRPSLLAQSFGCQVATAVASDFPELAGRLVLSGPTLDPRLRRWALRLLPWLRRPPGRGQMRPASPSPVDRLRPIPCRLVGRISSDDVPSLTALTVCEYLAFSLARAARTIHHALLDPQERRLRGVRAPALVVRGSEDRVTSQRWAEEVAGLLPHGRLRVLPGAGHGVNYYQPALLALEAIPFLLGAER
jgi:pimeloyl-ACP methyl ester carboxylesterase